MITAIRKIRQKLLTQNRFTKYLIYALGEIVLVVIGILIALQINNWSEHQKLRTEERKLLHSLAKEIESNLRILTTEIEDTKSIFDNSSKLIKTQHQTKQNQFKVAAILEALGYNTNKTQTSILDEIVSTNSRSLISNDSILSQLKTLKSDFDNNQKTQFYADEFWNTEVISYFKETGLGIYFSKVKSEESKTSTVEVNNTFFSLVGIMNGYQQALLFSREDLKETLTQTYKVITNYLANDLQITNQ